MMNKDKIEGQDSSVTGVSTTFKKGKNKKNLSQINCYNCNGKGYYVTKCLKPRKDKNILED